MPINDTLGAEGWTVDPITPIPAPALLAGSSTQPFSTSTLTASNIITATRSSPGATVEVMSLKNSGAGVNSKMELGLYAAGTKYASIIAGYGAAAPELRFDMSGVAAMLFYSAAITTPYTFGYNGKAGEVIQAAPATAVDLATALTAVNNIIARLKALGTYT